MAQLRSGQAAHEVGRPQPDELAARADVLHRAARRRQSADRARLASVAGGPVAMHALRRARTERSRAWGGPAFAAQAASPRRCDRSERSRPDQRRWPTAPARSWRGEGSGTRRQAAMRRTRSRLSALAEERSHCAQAIAAQGAHPICPSGTSSLITCHRQAGQPHLRACQGSA